MGKIDINWDDIIARLDESKTTRSKVTEDAGRLIRECHMRGFSGDNIRKALMEYLNIDLSRTTINNYRNEHKDSWS